MEQFEAELRGLINKHSVENGSNTPDFILASYLKACLDAWNVATNERERWFGRQTAPSNPFITKIVSPGTTAPEAAKERRDEDLHRNEDHPS